MSTSPFALAVPIASTSSLSPDAAERTAAAEGGGAKAARKTRTRNGCLTCRARKKRCDEQRPRCDGCSRLALECNWEDKEKAAVERREKREQRKREKALSIQSDGQQHARPSAPAAGGDRTSVASRGEEDLQGLEALATAGLISSMSGFAPTTSGEHPERDRSDGIDAVCVSFRSFELSHVRILSARSPGFLAHRSR